MKFSDIEQYTRSANYVIHVDWLGLEEQLAKWTKRDNSLAKLDIDPEFQRGHVWTEAKQIAYVEHVLKGGGVSAGTALIRFNCVGWSNDYRGPFVLVDGKQRLEAVRKFLRNELRVLKDKHNRKGFLLSEIEGPMPSHCCFQFAVNALPTHADVLKWYLEINTGGVVHTDEEIEKVKQMYDLELKTKTRRKI